MDKKERITFVALSLDLLKEDYNRHGLKGLFPGWILVCLGLGFGGTYFLPAAASQQSLYVTLFSGLITAQGVLMALTLTSLQNIQRTASEPNFSKYLKENNVLEYYLFFAQYMQGANVVSLLLLVGTAFMLLVPAPQKYLYIGMGASTGAFAYSIKQSLDASTLIRDLIWHHSLFAEKNTAKEGKNNIRSINQG